MRTSFRFASALVASTFLLASAQAGTARAAERPPLWPYTATVSSTSASGLTTGKTYDLIHLLNLTMEDIGTMAGQATLHVNLAGSPYACLNGASIDVFSFDGEFFLHDGLQGPECAYGTWELAPRSVLQPGQAPVITSAHVSAGPSTSLAPRLLALGRDFGTLAGSVTLIGYGSTSSGPVIGAKATRWAPTGVAAEASSGLVEGHLYYVLLLTGSGAAASALVRVQAGATARVKYAGAPPGTTVELTVGSRLAEIGKHAVRLGAAPALVDGTVLAPVGVLEFLTGARGRWDASTHQLRLATARSEVTLQLRNRRYAVNGRTEAGGAAPVFAGRVLLVPVKAFSQAFGLSVRQGPGHTLVLGGAIPMVICGPNCGGNGGGGGGGTGGNSGSGGSGTAQPVSETITTVYGVRGQGLAGGMNTSTWCNVPHAPSYLGGFPLGSCTAGPQQDNNPGGGIASVGTTVFGNAGGEADQPTELSYTSQAPSGVASTVSVKAIVDSVDMTYGISGVGGSCAPSDVNSSMQPGTDTLSTCLSTFQSVVPLGDAGTVTSAVLSYANQLWSGLNGAQQNCIDTPQYGPAGAGCALAAANALMSVEGTGLSVTLHQSVFTWNGATTGGTASYFSVDPEVQVSDVGLGTEVNFMTSYVLFVVTEQYTENQYTWSFPVAEVGQPLLAPDLEQCDGPSILDCQLVPGAHAKVTSGSFPNGMSPQSVGGYIELAGSPASGSEGVYQFTLQVVGGNAFDCTIDVAPPLLLGEQGRTSTFYYESGVGFAEEKAFLLPFFTTGGVGAVTWDLQGNSQATEWLGVSYSPPTSTSPGSPPTLYTFGPVPSSGSYPFELQAWDDYTSESSGPLSVDIVPRLALANQTAQEAISGEQFHWDLSTWRSGGAAPYSWEVDHCQGCGALPPGLSLDRTSGVISGAPSSAGTYHFVVVVTDALGATASTGMSVTVQAQEPLTVEPASLPAATVGSSYSAQLYESGTGSPSFRWEVSAGKLPPGLGLAVYSQKPWYGAKATIAGKPTEAGSFSFTVHLTDSKGRVATRSFTLKVGLKSSTTTGTTTCTSKTCTPPKV